MRHRTKRPRGRHQSWPLLGRSVVSGLRSPGADTVLGLSRRLRGQPSRAPARCDQPWSLAGPAAVSARLTSCPLVSGRKATPDQWVALYVIEDIITYRTSAST